jgi:hypothetical protein
MGDLFGSYENTFGTITAEITAKIGRIPSLEGGELTLTISDNQDVFLFNVVQLIMCQRRKKDRTEL